MIGIEYAASGEGPAGRTRFGLVPPPPLSEMPAGEIAMSDIVLLQAPSRGSDLPTTVTGALSQIMLGDEIARGARLGLYWELYGVAPADSVTFEVRVQRTTEQSRMRRLFTRLSIATDRNAPVAVRWTTLTAPPAGMVIGGAVPVVARTLVLQTGSLTPGTYVVEIAASVAGREPLRAERELVVR